MFSLRFTDGLKRRAGGRASLLPDHRLTRAGERPLLGTFLVVQALDPIKILIHLHVFNLPLGRGLAVKPKLGASVGVGCVGVSGSVRGTARGCRNGGDLASGQDSL